MPTKRLLARVDAEDRLKLDVADLGRFVVGRALLPVAFADGQECPSYAI